eukprot:CAMPEP_0174905670 /NCGR_PEP_ID=MMETSP0167-20121228/53885_1 /TAXON_ID=38298 /ORGANISM="Rhodella maculata, Strain CCMP736" /LENGTH=166 /DNA_ID=CAMNT_0016148683 /DNA_START=39 /DNA_END=535 /DNA_ORIENTATION=-
MNNGGGGSLKKKRLPPLSPGNNMALALPTTKVDMSSLESMLGNLFPSDTAGSSAFPRHDFRPPPQVTSPSSSRPASTPDPEDNANAASVMDIDPHQRPQSFYPVEVLPNSSTPPRSKSRRTTPASAAATANHNTARIEEQRSETSASTQLPPSHTPDLRWNPTPSA